MSEQEQPTGARALERHFQSIVLTVLAGVTGWFGMTVQDSTVKLATLTERLSGLERQISSTQSQAYTARDAQKDLDLRDSVVANLAARVLSLEARTRK